MFNKILNEIKCCLREQICPVNNISDENEKSSVLYAVAIEPLLI